LLQLHKDLITTVAKTGFSFCPSAAIQAWLLAQSDDALIDWSDFANSWNDMPLDQYMADGGRYRRRRYAVFTAPSKNGEILLEPHQPHYQSLNYNTLNGGIARELFVRKRYAVVACNLCLNSAKKYSVISCQIPLGTSSAINSGLNQMKKL
jgi:hypothetical protein